MDCPVVSTTLGKAKGLVLPKAKCDDAKQVFAFMGLPFAKPPVGELRFEPPQKLEPWKGVFDATKSPPVPLQSSQYTEYLMRYIPFPLVCNEDYKRMSEDCLYLNVYSSNPDKTSKMPVLVWLYGGGYTVGSSIGYNGQAICGLNDVVLVVPQYRLNVFGFLSMGEGTKWPGNMALLDQLMALRWTRDNIAAFGGDPDNVTIFGQSAGSTSVGLHVTSPMSRGLFHRAIGHSGVAVMPFLFKPDLTDGRKTFLARMKITATDPEEIMRQLKAVEATKLLEVLGTDAFDILFRATVDGQFIFKDTRQLTEEGNPVPYIIGVTNSEGSGVLSLGFTDGFTKGLDELTATQIATGMLSTYVPADKLEVVTKAVIDFYCAEFGDDKYKWSKLVSSILGDTWFVVPSIQQALAHSNAGHDTYMYFMTQQPRMHHDDAFSGNIEQKAEFCEADHGDDVLFTHGFPFMNLKFTKTASFSDDETTLSKHWMKRICNFAKTGNPNCCGEEEWPKYDPKSQKHLLLKWPYEIKSNPRESRFKFWTETFPALMQ